MPGQNPTPILAAGHPIGTQENQEPILMSIAASTVPGQNPTPILAAGHPIGIQENQEPILMSIAAALIRMGCRATVLSVYG